MIKFLKKLFKKEKTEYTYEEILEWFNKNKKLTSNLSELIFQKVIDNSGNQVGNLSKLEREILLHNPLSIVNLNGTLQYKGVNFK